MDITTKLKRLQLQVDTQPNSHMLFIEYPATSLIPSSPDSRFSLRLQPPKDAAYREMPNPLNNSLKGRSLEYFVRYNVILPQIRGFLRSEFCDLSPAIEQLSDCGGKSVLEAITVADNQSGENGYFFRLTTDWHGGGRHVHTFQMGEEAWRHLSGLQTSDPWTSLLQDLFSRASDRAYLHVKCRLQDSEYLATDANAWDCYDLSTTNELLALNMRQIKQHENLLCLEPLRDLRGNSNEQVLVRLPCDHERRVSVALLKALTRAECIDFACQMCGQSIMPETDIARAEKSVERRRRRRHAVDQILWNRVVTENEDLGITMHITGGALSHALCHALRSMRVPESMTPRKLCPGWSIEADAVLKNILAAYQVGSPFIVGTMDEIYGTLMRMVDAAVQPCSFDDTGVSVSCTVPDWAAFSAQWIERTVKLATFFAYAGEDIWTVFGEVPGEEICVEEDGAGMEDIQTLVNMISL